MEECFEIRGKCLEHTVQMCFVKSVGPNRDSGETGGVSCQRRRRIALSRS